MIDPRPLTDDELDRLEAVLSKTDIPVVVSATMELSDDRRLGGTATGWWRDTRRIVLAEQAFDRLDDEQLHALVVHQVGHHRGRHPLLRGVGNLVGVLLTASIGPLLTVIQVSDPLVTYPTIIALLLTGMFIVGTVCYRRLEFAADRHGATLLGSKAPLRALLRSAADDPSSGFRAKIAASCHPLPTARQRRSALESASLNRSTAG